MNMRLYNIQSYLVNTRLTELYKDSKINDETLNIYLKRCLVVKKRLEDGGLNLDDITNEQAYTQKYTYFELYLSEMLIFLYMNDSKLIQPNIKDII